MPLVEHNHVIETLAANRADKAFGDWVGLGRPSRRPHAGDSKASDPHIEIPSVDGVMVMNEMGRLVPPRSRLQQLLPDPGCRRTGGDVEGDQLTALVADEEEDTQDPVVNGVDDQQIGCPDALELIRQEGPPALTPRRRRLWAAGTGGWGGSR